ncbi:MAG: hypothetical protein K2X82_05155 [Gemmataceae bacterium]|nr:hypothetical protein [Gemmataceae bacterium]
MLDRNTFVVKERVKLVSNSNTYDILDGESGEVLGTAEERIGTLVQLARFFISKHLMPTRVEVREKPDDALVFTIRRGAYIFKTRVEVHDAQGELVGSFKSKFFTISGGFHIYDKDGRHFAEIKGKWLGWDYRLVTPDGSLEMGRVSKKLGAMGLVKEFFTSADTYAVSINPEMEEEPLAKMLILAAALAIDTIYKEESRTVDLGGLGE